MRSSTHAVGDVGGRRLTWKLKWRIHYARESLQGLRSIMGEVEALYNGGNDRYLEIENARGCRSPSTVESE